MLPRLLAPHEVDQFRRVRLIRPNEVTEEILAKVRRLHETEFLEPAIQEILYARDRTPHGPTEIADILTTSVRVNGEPRLGAFVLKGRSYPKVRPKDVTHQITRLRRLPGLQLIALCTVGDIQDEVKADLVQIARDAGCDYLILDTFETARLLIAYAKICPIDGTPFRDGLCEKGHSHGSWTEDLFSRAEEESLPLQAGFASDSSEWPEAISDFLQIGHRSQL